MMTRIAAIGLFAFSLPACAQPPRQHAPPPPSFAVEQASPQDLSALGLPPDTADHPKLLKALRDPRLHLPPPVEGFPAMRMRPHIPLGGFRQNPSNFAAGSATSGNWSGRVNVTPYPADSGTLETEIIDPGNTTHDGGLDFAAIWAGFGGWIDDTVLQAGVVCSSTFPCAAWYERFPDSLIQLYRVNDGDDVQIFVWHTVAAPHGHAIVYDATDGGYSNVAFDCSSCGDPPLTSREWVVERPEVNGAISILADYHTAVMINSSYSGHGGPGGNAPTNLDVGMIQNGATVSTCSTPDRNTMICEAYR